MLYQLSYRAFTAFWRAATVAKAGGVRNGFFTLSYDHFSDRQRDAWIQPHQDTGEAVVNERLGRF